MELARKKAEVTNPVQWETKVPQSGGGPSEVEIKSIGSKRVEVKTDQSSDAAKTSTTGNSIE